MTRWIDILFAALVTSAITLASATTVWWWVWR